jgi:purine-binding chemotaxis protein CheW
MIDNVSKNMQLVSFYVADKMYGIDINIIKEVNLNTNVAPIPRVNKKIRGLVNIRGQIVLAMDIAVIFGKEPRPLTEESHLIVLKTFSEVQRISNYEAGFDIARLGDKPMGFLVDNVGDVVSVDAAEIEPAPPHISKNKDGVVRLKEELLIILNVGDLLI